MSRFNSLLAARQKQGFMVCVGLDSEFVKIPECVTNGQSREEAIYTFNKEIVDAAYDKVLCFKPNIAFYPRQDDRRALWRTIRYIHNNAPGIPVILDAKRADIGNTNIGYAKEAFEEFEADAVTVNPYFGMEAMKPFLDQADKGIIVLDRTSNPGAGEFQDELVLLNDQEESELVSRLGTKEPLPGWLRLDLKHLLIPSYQRVAFRVSRYWNSKNNCALVVGATAPAELAVVRQIVGDMQILAPGIGKQGGDLIATLQAGLTADGTGLIINSSSGIIFASKGEDYAEAALAEVEKLNKAINEHRHRR